MFYILDTFNHEKRYFVFHEKQYVAEASSFLDGLTWILGLYHMFNINYPKEVALTLEFLQRYCLKINSNKMNGHKRTQNNFVRVLNLISKLTDNHDPLGI